MKMHVIKMRDTMLPVDAADQASLAKLTDGEIIEISYRKARFYPLLKKYFASCELIAQNHRKPEFSYLDSKEKIDYYCRCRGGLIEFTIVTPKATVVKAKSIGYDAMDQDTFQDYYDRAIAIMSDVSGIPIREIELNWQKYLTKNGDNE